MGWPLECGPNLSLFHKMWTSVLVVARNPDDIQALAKTESRKLQAVYFGLDVRRGGNFVYLTEQKRLTTVKFDDCHYEPDIYPELPKFITGIQLVGDITFRLPTLSEQDAVAEQDARDRDVGSPVGYIPMQTASPAAAVTPPMASTWLQLRG